MTEKKIQLCGPVNIYNPINKEWELGTVVRTKFLSQEHAQFTRATKNIGGRENIQSELLQTHWRVAQPPTSHQRSTSRSQAMNLRTRTSRIYRHRMKHRAKQHSAILINKGLNNPHLQEMRPQCKLHAMGEQSNCPKDWIIVKHEHYHFSVIISW